MRGNMMSIWWGTLHEDLALIAFGVTFATVCIALLWWSDRF